MQPIFIKQLFFPFGTMVRHIITAQAIMKIIIVIIEC